MKTAVTFVCPHSGSRFFVDSLADRQVALTISLPNFARVALILQPETAAQLADALKAHASEEVMA